MSAGNKEYELLVEGCDLRGVMGIPGVMGERTTCNHIMEVEKRLGTQQNTTNSCSCCLFFPKLLLCVCFSSMHSCH